MVYMRVSLTCYFTPRDLPGSGSERLRNLACRVPACLAVRLDPAPMPAFVDTTDRTEPISWTRSLSLTSGNV